MSNVRTALVIGGGIAGPVTALALARAGIQATVHEAYATPADGVGGLLMVAPNGLEALRIIGADEAVQAVGQPIQRMVVDDPYGKPLAEFGGAPGLQPGQVVFRSDLYRVLHDRLREEGVAVEYGKRLTTVKETSSGVTARFADGSTATGDVLIGADGILSTVRTLIDPATPGPTGVGLLGLGGFSEYTPPGARPDAMHFANGKRAFFGHWTRPEGGTLWFSNLPREKSISLTEARAVPAADWLRELRAVHAEDLPARDVLAQADPADVETFGSLEILPSVPHWYRGRLVLVGDAAHAPSSSSGQGASISIESAIELARCLRDLPDLPTAFAAYERLRRARVEKIAADAMRTNNQKAARPIARSLMRMLAPIAMKTFLKPEKMFGPVHGYRIDWDTPVTI
jgi:2-polyprenyl-6-methoxyphenol hydroxylase-like FAD-dependent oxidoreductase